MCPQSDGTDVSRRTVLQAGAAASSIPLLEAYTGSVDAAEPPADVEQLEGLTDASAWEPHGKEHVTAIDATLLPRVTEQTDALWIDPKAESRPGATHPDLLAGGTLADRPYLLVDVFRYNPVTRAPIEITIAAGQANESTPVVTKTATVDEPAMTTVTWDVSDLARSTRRALSWVTVAWQPLEAEAEYDGHLYLHDLRTTADGEYVDAKRLRRHEQELRAVHGSVERRSSETPRDGATDGILFYADGTEIAYRIERLSDGTIRYELGDETYRLRGEQR